MTRAKDVEIDARVLRAYPWLPRRAPVGGVVIGYDGTTLRVLADGSVAPWPVFGSKSIASDPAPRRRP